MGTTSTDIIERETLGPEPTPLPTTEALKTSEHTHPALPMCEFQNNPEEYHIIHKNRTAKINSELENLVAFFSEKYSNCSETCDLATVLIQENTEQYSSL